jgi:hypothetical protein
VFIARESRFTLFRIMPRSGGEFRTLLYHLASPCANPEIEGRMNKSWSNAVKMDHG